MVIDTGSASVALEICDAFGARPSRSSVLGAFHETLAAVSKMRHQSSPPAAAREDGSNQGNHLVFMVTLVCKNLDRCLPDEREIVERELGAMRSWLTRHGFHAQTAI